MSRWRTWLCVWSLLVGVGFAAPMLYASPKAAPEAQDTGTGHGTSHDAPNIFGGSLFATLVSIGVFLGLIAVLSKTAYPKILAGLKTREEKIEQSLKAAEQAAQETERITAELEAKMLATRAEASKLVEKSKQDAVLIAQTEMEKVRSDIKLEQERAKREIQIAKDTALQEIVEQAAEWSVQMAGKIVQQELTPEKHRELIVQAMEQLKNVNN